MNEKIRSHVERLFEDAPKTKQAFDLKEELIANMQERYRDLLAQGKDEETAVNIVIAGLGDVDELISGLKEKAPFDYGQAEKRQQVSAMRIAIAVMIYIVSLIFPLIGDRIGLDDFMLLPMIFCWAGATGLLIYNALTRPKYVKQDVTMVEEFKEWQVEKHVGKAQIRSIHSIVWSLAVIFYLVTGFWFGFWAVGWIVFLVAAVINQIISLVIQYKRG